MRRSLSALLLPTVLLGSVLATASQPITAQPVPVLPPAPAPVQAVPATPSSGPAVPEPAPPAVLPGVQPSGLRGLWVDGFGPGLRTPAEVAQMVSDAAGLGFNALFVQAVRRGDCLCLQASVPAAGDLQKGFDPLAETIRLAHARHLRVLAWVSVTGAWNASLPSAGKTQVFAQHGPDARDSWLSRQPDGSWRSGSDAWLDPAIPAAADHMVRSAVSLVRNYDLDGLQLDRIRYPDGGDWGYSPVTLARYRQETGQVGVPAPTDERWKAWKREQVTDLVRRTALEARALKPGIIISAATIVYGDAPADLNAFHATRTYSEVLQDWPEWMQAGLLDLNVIMNYKRDGVGGQEGWYDRWNAFLLAQRRGTGEAAAGTSMYLNPAAVTAAQAGRATALGLGWVGYAYRTPTADVYAGHQTQPQGFAALKGATASMPGLFSPLPAWNITVQARRAVLGRVTGTSQPGGLSVSAYGTDGALLETVKTDANGYYGFPDLPAGQTEVRVGHQTWTQPLTLGVNRFPTLLLKTLVRSTP